MVKLQHAKDAS